jgi:hypothetical protein
MDTFRTATREREKVSQSETTVWAAALTSVCSDGLIWLSSVDQSPIERKCRRKRKKSRSLQWPGGSPAVTVQMRPGGSPVPMQMWPRESLPELERLGEVLLREEAVQ